MVNVLIGYSGFIGSYLNSKFPTKFQVRLNSSSISDVTMDKINELVIAAPSGSKYLVNKNSSEDLANINQIVAFIKRCKSINKVILISSLDALKGGNAYGENRKFLVDKLKAIKDLDLYVFYLGMVFGNGAHKGMIYDFAQGNSTYYGKGMFQFYPVSYLADDIYRNVYREQRHEAVLASEPISSDYIAGKFNLELNPDVPEQNWDIKPLGSENLLSVSAINCSIALYCRHNIQYETYRLPLTS